MSAKNRNNLVDSARDAVTGYTAVVLGIVCFILALVLLMAAVRLVVGLTPGGASATAASALPASTTAATQERA